jgi:predicted nucleotidyltransferase
MARGQERPGSDIDVAVLFTGTPAPEDLNRLVADLETASDRTIDLVVLNVAPPLLAHEIISTGSCLLSRDDDERARFEVRAISRYLDTAYLRNIQRAYLRERVDAHRARAR